MHLTQVMGRIDLLLSMILLLSGILLEILFLIFSQIKGPPSRACLRDWAAQPFRRLIHDFNLPLYTLNLAEVILGALCALSLSQGYFGISAALGLFMITIGIAKAINPPAKSAQSIANRYIDFFIFAGLLYLYKNQIGNQVLAVLALSGLVISNYTMVIYKNTHNSAGLRTFEHGDLKIYLVVGLTLTPIFSMWQAKQSTLPILISLGFITCLGNGSVIVQIRQIRKTVQDRESRAIALTLVQIRSIQSGQNK